MEFAEFRLFNIRNIRLLLENQFTVLNGSHDTAKVPVYILFQNELASRNVP